MSSDNNYFGTDCPVGRVQVEFVTTNSEKYSEHGWKPSNYASVDVYIDGERFLIQIGDYHDGIAQRRGIHIIGPLNLVAEKTAMNACSIFVSPSERLAGSELCPSPGPPQHKVVASSW